LLQQLEEHYNIAVAGLGLLGGSLAKILRKKYGNNINLWAFSREETLEKAKRFSLFDHYYLYDNIPKYLEKIDILFLCTPISVIIDLIEKIKSSLNYPLKKKLIISDIGSTKKTIMESAIGLSNYNITFIGGHPMTGSEFSGFDYSDPYIFENSIYVLTPYKDDLESKELKLLSSIIENIGAKVLVLDYELHDRLAAMISHLPQIIAVELVNLLDGEDDSEIGRTLAAGGFRDLTRIASSDFRIWKDIIDTNKDNIFNYIDKFIQKLEEAKNKINSNLIEEDFKRAKSVRDLIPKDTRGFISPIWELIVRVPDKPGVLYKISKILSDENINIKDISVVKIREHESGSIKLGFETKYDREKAYNLLTKNGIETIIRE